MAILLLILLALPFVTAIVAALLGPGRTALIRQVCLGATIADVVIAVLLVIGFFQARGQFEPLSTFRPEIVPGATFAEPHKTTWTLIDFGPAGTVQFYLGLDGLNIWLVVLTTVLLAASVLISWNAITERTNEYYAWLMALGAAMLGVFLSFDIILFYIFFELTLVPLFFLIGIWGGSQRRYASRKFFIYTLTGSLVTLLGIFAIVLVVQQETQQFVFSIPELVAHTQHLRETGRMTASFQVWVFLALMAGFAIKVPLFPVHTWLPLAHTEAPTAGSVLLAGILLKLGTYGFLRLTLPLAPAAAWSVGLPLIGTLSVIAISYGAFCSRAQDDIKKLVAYSSVSHLGFCTLGLFALNPAGLTGGMLQMLNHGLSTGALFLLVGMLYERYHTRQMSDYSGMASRLGWMAAAWVFVCLSSVGLPGLNGFVGEALVFFGMFDTNPAFAFAGAAGIILGAWYLFTLLRVVFFGPLKEPIHEGEHPITDLTGREIAILAPILALCLFIGVYPQPLINAMKPEVTMVANILQDHRTVGDAASVARAEETR